MYLTNISGQFLTIIKHIIFKFYVHQFLEMYFDLNTGRPLGVKKNTFDDTVALLKYNLEFVNLLRGSISSASVYRSCAFCTFPKRNSVFPSSFFAFKAFAFYKQFVIFLIHFQQKCGRQN